MKRTTKLSLAFDALEFANGNVTEAKRIITAHGDRIAARTWHKAIQARLAHLAKEDRSRSVFSAPLVTPCNCDTE